jgi:hypothetical protein
MLFLAVGMLVVGLLILAIAGLQLIFYVIDLARGETGAPKRGPVDVALYWLTGTGAVLFIAGFWLWRAGAAG